MPPENAENANPAHQPHVTPHDDSSTLLPMLIAGLVLITVGYAVIMMFV